MGVYKLTPITGALGHPKWLRSEIRETCWLIANSEDNARSKVAAATTAAEFAGASSPWLDIRLALCELQSDNEGWQLREGGIILKNGKTIT